MLGLTFKRDTDDPRDSLSFKLIRLLERELCHVARHDPFLPDQSDPLDEALSGAEAVIVATNHSAYEGVAAPQLAPQTLLVRPVERDRAPGRCSPSRTSSSPADAMNRVLVTGGAGTIGQALVRRLLSDPDWEVRVADQRTPPQWMREACEIHIGDLREPTRSPTRDRRLHARHPPGRDRRRDRELPQAAAHAARGEHGALQLGLPRGAGRGRRAVRVRLVVDGVRARDAVPDAARSTCTTCPAPRSAYGFSKLAGEVYCRALADEHGLRYTICGPFNAYGPGEVPERRAGNRARRARPDPQVARPAAAAPDLRLGRADAHAHATSTTSPTGSSPRWRTRPPRARTSTSRRRTS